jgi:sulfonate transport system substrate-binding protein
VIKNTGKILALALTFILTSALLPGCANTEKEPAEKDSVKTVRLGVVSNPAQENIGLALKLGYVQEELAKIGYQLEELNFSQGAGPAINEAFAAKSADFAVYAEFPQLVVRDKGVDIKIIAPVNSESQYVILVRDDSGIASVTDLEGKKIIVPKGTILQKVFSNVTDKYGADISKIEQLNAVADAQSVYASGETDAIIVGTQNAYALKALSGGQIIYSTAQDPEWSTGQFLAGRSEYIDENPEAAKAFIRALYRSYLFAQENPEETFAHLTSALFPTALVKQYYTYSPDFAIFKPEFNQAVITRIDGTNEFLAKQGLISSKIDLNEFIDTQYYDAVKNEFNEEGER